MWEFVLPKCQSLQYSTGCSAYLLAGTLWHAAVLVGHKQIFLLNRGGGKLQCGLVNALLL